MRSQTGGSHPNGLGELHRLALEAMDLTGAAPPALLEEDSPGLAEEALGETDGELYLVGVIGGKDVGKSALVNALVGAEITPRTSHGPGTETVIAYVHETREAELRRILDQEAPGLYRIVSHRQAKLARQALLDLPDIDSHYEAHIDLTRRMLRRMLFPIWMQSVEKYADYKPQVLLARVAEGNAPENFLFCLNKLDQLSPAERESAAPELRRDYGERLARRLGLSEPPRVWLVSALHPDQFDLPDLRRMVMSQKSESAVAGSRALAARRREASLTRWLRARDMAATAERLDRMRAEAGDELAARVLDPLLRDAMPALWADPAHRLRLGDEAFAERIRRWPLVRGLNQALAPVARLLRMRLPAARQEVGAGPRGLIMTHLRIGERPLAENLQCAFGSLRLAHPSLARLYGERRYWDQEWAERAADELAARLAATIDRQRAATRMKAARIGGPAAAAGRAAMTIGALIWFPFLQPTLESMMLGGQGLIPALIHIFSVAYLLSHGAMLGLYFFALWIGLRWDTQRRVDNWINAWLGSDGLDRELSLTARMREWADGLIEPINMASERARGLCRRIEAATAEGAGRAEVSVV